MKYLIDYKTIPLHKMFLSGLNLCYNLMKKIKAQNISELEDSLPRYCWNKKKKKKKNIYIYIYIYMATQ